MNSIRGKIVGGFLVMLAFVVAQFFLVDHYLGRSRDQVDRAINHNYAASSMLSELAITGQAIRRYEKEYFIYHDDREGSAKYAKEWDDTYGKIEKHLALMKKNAGDVFSKAEVQEFDLWESELAVYGSEMRKIRSGVEQSLAQVPPAILPTRELNAQIKIGKDRFAQPAEGRHGDGEAQGDGGGGVGDARSRQTSRRWRRHAAVAWSAAAWSSSRCCSSRCRAPSPSRSTSLVSAAESMSKGKLEDSIASAGIAEFVTLEKALERMRITQLAMIERMKRKA